MPLRFTTLRRNMQIFAVSEVLGGPYSNRTVNSGTVTDAPNLIFIW